MLSSVVVVRLLLVVGLVALARLAHAASPPVTVGAGDALVRTEGHVDVLLDPSGNLSLAQVREAEARFQPVGDRAYSKPLEDAAVWLRLELATTADRPIDRVLALAVPLIDQVDAFIAQPDGSFTHHGAGESIDPAARVIETSTPQFPVTLVPGHPLRVYLRLYDEGQLAVPLAVGTAGALEERDLHREVVTGLLMGMVLVVLLYAGHFWLRFGEAVYGWLFLALVGDLGILATLLWGRVGFWLPAAHRDYIVNRLIGVSVFTAAAGIIGFLIELLALKRHQPRLRRLLRLWLAYYPLATAAVLFVPYLAWIMMMFVGFVPLPALVVVALGRGRRDRTAFIVGCALVALAAGIALQALRASGLLPPTPFNEYAAQVAFVVHLGMLSFAAADRVDKIERQKRAALEGRLAEAQRNLKLSRTFERFVPKEFLERLEQRDITQIELGQCVEKEMTTLFSDIRDFTSLVENMTPDENFTFINEYLGYMEPAIHGQRGFIDKYIGDAVMALFDSSGDDDRGGAVRAVSAAVAMQRALERYNGVRKERGEATLAIGIGLHTGRLMLGTIGGRERLNASVIGDAVNLASRVEGLTKVYGARVLVTEQTAAALPKASGITLRVVDRVRVKGKGQAVTVFEVLDGESDALQAQKRATLERFRTAWARYLKGEFTEAAGLYRACAEVSPDDPLIELHLKRCEQLERDGVDESWDGAVEVPAK